MSESTFETATNLFASRVKKIIFYAVMVAKRFQTRTEEEIEQLLHDKSSKSTNKATDNAVTFQRSLKGILHSANKYRLDCLKCINKSNSHG